MRFRCNFLDVYGVSGLGKPRGGLKLDTPSREDRGADCSGEFTIHKPARDAGSDHQCIENLNPISWRRWGGTRSPPSTNYVGHRGLCSGPWLSPAQTRMRGRSIAAPPSISSHGEHRRRARGHDLRRQRAGGCRHVDQASAMNRTGVPASAYRARGLMLQSVAKRRMASATAHPCKRCAEGAETECFCALTFAR